MTVATTISSYAFPTSTSLSGIVLRGFACGKVMNTSASGIVEFFNILTSMNNTTLAARGVYLPQSTIPSSWFCWTHFYFTAAQSPAGITPSVGSSLHLGVSNPGQDATVCGGYVGQEHFTVETNPYNNFCPGAQQTNLAVTFSPNNPSTMLFEVHTAYLEAL